MELFSQITKNPLVLYRGSDIKKDWYVKLQTTSQQLPITLKKIEDYQRRIEQEKYILTFQLEGLFAELKDKVILNVKRDVHNLRIKRIQKYSKEIMDTVKNVNFDRLINLFEEREAMCSSYDESFQSVLDHNRTILQSDIKDEELLKTVIFFNEQIYENVQKYLNVDVKDHNKKLRKLDYFLLKLLMRASMKTSPFSYLTKVGSASPYFKPKVNTHVEINHAMLFNIFYGFLRSNKDALKKIPIEVSNFGKRGTSIYYVSQRNTANSKKVYETSDQFVEFTLENTLIDFIELYKGKEMTFQIFKDRLRSLGLYHGQELALFKKLVELKIFVQKVSIGSQGNIITHMIQYLEKNQLDPIFIENLKALQEQLVCFDTGGLDQRRSAWKTIKEMVDKLMGEKSNFGSELLYEDVVFSQTLQDEGISKKISNEFIESISEFTLLFDVNIRVQYELAEIFRRKYGEKVVHLGDSKMLNEVFFENIHHFYPYYQDIGYRYENALAEQVRKLDEIRDAFVYELTEQMKQETEEFNIKPLIQKYINKIPHDYKQFSETSITIFAQQSEDHVIINDIYDGQEKFLSRFKDYFEQSGDQGVDTYQEYLNKNYQDKNYYEVDELFGFNGGIHDRNTSKKLNLNIGYQRFCNQQLPSIHDFSIAYHSESRKLTLLDEQGKEARIAYKSSLVPIFLPGILSVMLLLFQSGRLNFNIHELAKKHNQLSRLTFDDIVLYRKRWNIDGDDLNQLITSPSSESEMYKVLHQYFDEMELPKQFFLNQYKADGEFAKAKPMFIDVNVPILFRLFINECKNGLRQQKQFYLEEVLPEPDVTLREYMIEYTIDKHPKAVLI